MRPWTAAALALALVSCAAEETRPAPPAPAPAPAAAKPPEVPVPALTGTLPGDRIPEFRAKLAGSGAVLDPRASAKPVVLVVMSTTCPDCAEAVEPLRRAEAAFLPRGVEFAYLYPVRAESDEEKAAWHAGKGFRAGQVLDAGAEVSKLLSVNKTPTAFVVGPGGGILYRGAVFAAPEGGGAASHFLADALDEHLAGKAISVPSTEPAG